MSKRSHLTAFPDEPAVGRGHKQRLAASASAADDLAQPSGLASFCLESWSWVCMPATTMQKICALSKSDNDAMGQQTHTEICKLASLGSDGAFVNNCHRDLVEFRLKKPPIIRHWLVSKLG